MSWVIVFVFVIKCTIYTAASCWMDEIRLKTRAWLYQRDVIPFFYKTEEVCDTLVVVVALLYCW